ncbi:MAG: hypothetical protein GXO39_05325 [Thermotogae bacterium]|nr:hypothetical protein [Thermotogota bacterium]
MPLGIGVEAKLKEGVIRIMNEIEDAEVALFATDEGLPVVFESRYNVGIVDRLAALSAMLFGVSRKSSNIVKMGDLVHLELALEMGRLFLFRVVKEVFLVILTSPETNVGLVRLIAKEVSKAARELLEGNRRR